MQAQITPFFHAPTSTWSYLVRDAATGEAAIIDAALDFDPATGELGHASAAAILQAAERDGAQVRWILETHAHADHLSAAAWLRASTGAQTAIGAGIEQVQEARQDDTAEHQQADELYLVPLHKERPARRE